MDKSYCNSMLQFLFKKFVNLKHMIGKFSIEHVRFGKRLRVLNKIAMNSKKLSLKYISVLVVNAIA